MKEEKRGGCQRKGEERRMTEERRGEKDERGKERGMEYLILLNNLVNFFFYHLTMSFHSLETRAVLSQFIYSRLTHFVIRNSCLCDIFDIVMSDKCLNY